MADAIDRLSDPDLAPEEQADVSNNRQRLLVVGPPASRAKEGRPVTSLATVFGRFAETQQLVGEQVIALEDCVEQQGSQLADVSAQLPDMKERINWLIASYYEEEQKSAAMRARLESQEAGLSTLTDAVRDLCEAQNQWKQTLDQLMQILGRAQTMAVAAPPRRAESKTA